MKKGKDVSAKFSGLYLVHQNLPGYFRNKVILEQHLLFIPLCGEIALTVAGETLKLGHGRMLYLPPNTPHSFSSSKFQGERLIVLIEQKLWKKKGTTKFKPSVLPLNQLTRELLFYLLLNPKSPYSKSLVEVLTETLIESLCHMTQSSTEDSIDHIESKVRDFRVMAALEYMKSNYSNALSMSVVARKAGLSLRSLNRLVLEETTLSPRHVLIRYRIARACELLMERNKSVTEVALEVGYNSLSQFIASFRSVTGKLPSEFSSQGKGLASYRR
jgi:AraC-like DNA-binding protein